MSLNVKEDLLKAIADSKRISAKDEVIKEIEEYIRDADKCISENDDYIRGWKSALLVALELMTKLT